MYVFDVFSINGIENYSAASEIFLENVILKVSQTQFSKDFYPKGGIHFWMMINHSTLEYHVTNFNTFFRWLWRKNQSPYMLHSTLTLTITLTTTITQTTTKTLTLTRNLTFSLKWPCHVMSSDRCSLLPITCQGSILKNLEIRV